MSDEQITGRTILEIYDSILQESKHERSNLDKLKNEFTGSVIEPEKLKEIGFYKIKDADEHNWSTWARQVNGKWSRVVIRVSKYGTVGAITYSRFLDLTEDGFGAPYGYYSMGDISTVMYNKIGNVLGTAVVEAKPTEKGPLLLWILEKLNFNYKAYVNDFSLEEMLGYLIGQDYASGQRDKAASLLILSLKHCSEIKDASFLLDAAFYCARLNLYEEFFRCIQRLRNLKIDANDTGLCNIGSGLCDELKLYRQAVMCFIKALEINPTLPQAQYNIFMAGKHRIVELLNASSFSEAVSLGELIMQLGKTTNDHGFYSYMGLAYESIGEMNLAQEYYRKALDLDPHCSTSKQSLQRISMPEWNKNDLVRHIRWLSHQYTYDQLIPE